jgi:SPP1 gp7 family putative phage head morphogenesis protein
MHRHSVIKLALKARGLRKSFVKPPRVPFPKGIVVDYLAFLRRYLAISHSLVVSRLVPMLPDLAAEARATRGDSARADASYVDSLTQIVAQIAKDSLKQAIQDPALIAELRALVQRTNEYAARGTAQQIKAVVGIEVTADVPGMSALADGFVAQNVALIKSLPEDYLYDVEQSTLRAFRQGQRAEEIASLLTERYGVSESRAALIAQDQIGKLNGEIVEARQKGLGITHYTWSTSEDERVRPEHEDRDGKPFAWDDPPQDGHPGQPIRCRCSAIPILDDES